VKRDGNTSRSATTFSKSALLERHPLFQELESGIRERIAAYATRHRLLLMLDEFPAGRIRVSSRACMNPLGRRRPQQ
jgi:hypothetical protein